jgi:hypothetical protein
MAASLRMTALATSMASAPALPSNETWYVATNLGVRTLCLDDLERELASGELDVNTPVWIPGMAEWESLGRVANLEDGSPLDQGPGIPPYHGAASSSGLVEVVEPDPDSVVGPLSQGLSADPSDPNHALWASVSPRASRPVQSGIWRRVDVAHTARRRPWATPARQLLCATILAGVVLMVLSVLVATS